jgi:hypothetical protein
MFQRDQRPVAAVILPRLMQRPPEPSLLADQEIVHEELRQAALDLERRRRRIAGERDHGPERDQEENAGRKSTAHSRGLDHDSPTRRTDRGPR